MPAAKPLTPEQREHRALLTRNLKRARRARGLSQEAVALAAGLDRSFYVDVENGRHTLAVDRLWDIAEALGTSPAELLRLDHQVLSGRAK